MNQRKSLLITRSRVLANLILYCDGSGKNFFSSWAILALSNDTIQEHYGSYRFGVSHPQRDQFEDIAFLQACLYARDQQISPEDTTIYTDSLVLSNLGSIWNPENFDGLKPALTKKFTTLLVAMGFDGNVLDTITPYFEHARLSYLRSHRGFVYQERVDYLAKMAAENETPLDYDTWLARGVSYWRNPSEVYRYPFAFVTMAESSDLPSPAQHPMQLHGNSIRWPEKLSCVSIQTFIALAGLRLHMQKHQNRWSAELKECILDQRGGHRIHVRAYGDHEEQALMTLAQLLAGKAYRQKTIANRSGSDINFPEHWASMSSSP